jgi:hypothetical protein
MIVQAFSGLALLTQTIPLINASPRDLLIGWWLGVLVGSTDMAGWYARTAHYIINWLFIILTTIHMYLSVTEDFPAFLDFFGLGGLDKRSGHGDGEGHDEHAPEPAPAYASAEHA